ATALPAPSRRPASVQLELPQDLLGDLARGPAGGAVGDVLLSIGESGDDDVFALAAPDVAHEPSELVTRIVGRALLADAPRSRLPVERPAVVGLLDHRDLLRDLEGVFRYRELLAPELLPEGDLLVG